MPHAAIDMPIQDHLLEEPVLDCAPGRRREVVAALRSWLRPALLLTVATSFLQFTFFAVQGILLARMLGPTGRGEFGTAVFYFQTMLYLGLLGTLFAVTRRVANDPASQSALTGSVFRLAMITGMSTIAAASLFAYVTLPADKRLLLPLCVVACLVLPFEHWRLLLLAIDQGSNAFRRYNVNQAVTTAILPLLLFVLWISGGCSVPVAVLLMLVPPVIGLLVRLFLQRQPALAATTETIPASKLIREGMPYLFSVAASDLFSRVDIFLFLYLASFAAQGYYAVAVPAAGLLLVAPEALTLFSFNAGARGDVMPHRIYLAGAGVAVFQAASAMAFAVIVGRLIQWMYGASFADALPLTWALLPGVAVNGCGRVADGYLRGRGKVQAGIWARAIGLPLMVAVAFALRPLWGDLAIPLASSVAHGVAALVLVAALISDVSGSRTYEASLIAAGGDL